MRVRRAKNNQFADRVHYVALVEVPGSYMCPVTWWERHVRINPAKDDDPAFCFGKTKTPMTHSLLVKSLKDVLARAGYDPTVFSGHSFRRGAATDAFNMKLPHDQIQLQGDWLSTAFLLYNETTDEYRLHLPSKVAAAIQAAKMSWSPPR